MIELKYIIIFLLAIIPVAVWMPIFLRGNKVNKWLVFFTFIGGIMAAQLILLYKGYWDNTINLIFIKVDVVDFRSNIESLILNTALAGFVIFLGIGAMEEFFKFWVMKLINKNFFRSIDDVISLAIVSALGFSFYENMVYFNAQWGVLEIKTFTLLVISRVTIVTMVHVLCSGILGYYFGLAHFASPLLKLQHAEKKRHSILIFFKNLLHMSKSHLYHNEMMVIGLVLAMFLHAIYNFVLSSLVNLNPIIVSATILTYFFGGYFFLMYLLKKKESRLDMGLIINNIEDDAPNE